MSKKGRRNKTNAAEKATSTVGQRTEPAKENPVREGFAQGGSRKESIAKGNSLSTNENQPSSQKRTAASSLKKEKRVPRTYAQPFWNGRGILLSLFTLMMIIIPYFKGLFFDADMITADLLFTGLSLFTLIMFRKRSEALFKTPIPYLVFAILLIYFLGAFQGIVPNLAYDEAFRWVTYLITFTALILLIDRQRRAILLHGLLLSMLWVSLFGLLAHFGLVSFQDAMLGNRIASVLQYPNTYAAVAAALMIGILFAAGAKAARADEGRDREGNLTGEAKGKLAGTSNANSNGSSSATSSGALKEASKIASDAAVMGAANGVPNGTSGRGLAEASKKKSGEGGIQGNRRESLLLTAIPFLYLLFLPALLIAFVYSQSRATWLLFPIVWFAGLFFLNLKQQLHYAFTTLLVSAGTLPLLPLYDKAAQAKDGRFLLLLAGIGLLYAAISYGAAVLMRKWGFSPRKAMSRFLLPILFLIAGFAALTLIQTPAVVKVLPEAIQSRFSDINLTTRSVTERGTFYEDSITLFKDHWLIGAGGNAWKGLFLKYETLPYYSSQTHSFAMKVLVDTGIAGSLLFLSFFGLILYQLIRAYRKESFSFAILNRTGLPLLTGLMLFLHSLVDFDMSYGYYVLLFLAFLAILYADGREHGGEIRIPYLSQSRQSGLIPWLQGAFLLFMAVPYLFIILFAAAQSIPVDHLSAQEARANADRKVALKPVSVDYRLMRMEILGQIGRQGGDEKSLQEAFAEGERILSLDRHNPQTALRVARFFGQYGQGVKALEITDTALKNGNWFLSAYEQYISFAAQVALAQLREGKRPEAEGNLKRVDDLLRELESKRTMLDKRIESQRYPEFSYTEPIRRYGGEALVLLGEYERAAQLLDPIKGSADPQTKGDAFLWLSIAKEKLGLTGEAAPLLEEAKKVDPALEGKRAEIMRLIQTTP